jgi:hypothetical protein
VHHVTMVTRPFVSYFQDKTKESGDIQSTMYIQQAAEYALLFSFMFCEHIGWKQIYDASNKEKHVKPHITRMGTFVKRRGCSPKVHSILMANAITYEHS